MKLLIALMLLTCVPTLMAVRLGVSKTQTTTSTTTTTTTTATTTNPMTTIDSFLETTSELLTSSLADDDETTSTTAQPEKVTFPIFSVPTLPTKLPKKNKNMKKPKTTATPVLVEPVDIDGNVSATSSSPEKPLNKHFCSCDLNDNACDVNCCCDPECSKEALAVFNCNVKPLHRELESRLEDFNYQHGLPSCKINDGWLCVFRTNTHDHKMKENWHIPRDSSKLHKWPNAMVTPTVATTVVDFYKYGEPVKVFNESSGEFQNIDLPFPFNPPFCHINEPLRHLKPIRHSCLMGSLADTLAIRSYLLNLASSAKLLPKPQSDKTDLPSDDIAVKICHSLVCREVNATDTKTPTSNTTQYLTKVLVHIAHNYTQLQKIVIELHESELKEENETSQELWQLFEVRFSLEKHMEQHNRQAISGPLGYLQGEPVIKAKFIAHDKREELTESNRVLDYFHENSTQSRHNHSLLAFSRAQCLRQFKPNDENTINYGINVMSECKVKVANELLGATKNLTSINFTATCLKLQALAMQHLTGGLTDIEQLGELQISELGRPENRTERWLPLQLRNYEFVPITGELNETSATFVCRNVILNIGYEFHGGSVFVASGVGRQSLLKAASVFVGARMDLEFALNETIEVPLRMTAMFYDLSTGHAINLKAKALITILVCFVVCCVVM